MLICAGLYKVLMCSHNITIACIVLLNNRKIHYATNLPPLPLYAVKKNTEVGIRRIPAYPPPQYTIINNTN